MIKKTQLAPEAAAFSRWRALWISLVALMVISPIGLLAPGTAWGEWGAEELTTMGLPFVPQGMQQLAGLWSAPMPDYDIPGLGNANLAYILSALVGIFITVIVVWLFSTLAVTAKKSQPEQN